MTVTGATLQASGLSKWFGQVIAVNDLTFESSASIVGLLGPNGAGKSTLIKLLTGQLRPSKGEVRVFGKDPWNNRKLFSDLGYCPEHDRFYEDLTPTQFVTLLTRLQGYPQPEALRLAGEALEKVELTGKKDAPIRTLSHGMRQKLKVAQALAHRPGWLVLDEPLSGMDPMGRARMIALMREQAGQGVRVLVSSHVLHELEAMTTDIIMLNKGRLLAQGQVQQIRNMIDKHPHRILLTVQRPRDLGRELLRHSDVVRVEVQGEQLIIETRSPDACYTRIGELAAGDDFMVQSMVSLDDNLEAVFRYLVK
jgi:ABC-2 type transport system ATP-binding protein